MLAILVWLVLFILGSNYILTESLTLWPDFWIVQFSKWFGWLCFWAIAGFIVWCFAEE